MASMLAHSNSMNHPHTLNDDVEDAVHIIKQQRSRRKVLAIAVLVVGVLGMLGLTAAMYSSSTGRASAGQVGEDSARALSR